MTNLEYADSLEQIAAFYREHPDMPNTGEYFYVFLYEKPKFLKSVRELSRGGTVRKTADKGDQVLADYHAMRTFGSITMDVRISRKTICRLVRAAEYECPDSLLEEGKEFVEA